MPYRHLNSSAMFPYLCCEEEEHWDNNNNNNGDIIQKIPNNSLIEEGESFSDHSFNPKPLLGLLLEQNFLWEDEELSYLLAKENENELKSRSGESPLLIRGEAVEWMLKAVGFHSFCAHTAVLAVNYFDRFLHSFKSHIEKPWIAHLAAVACLSLAAKVVETHVPLLLHLQVDCKFVLEPKTIQRMEILVLSTLKWKMNLVTPCSFLEYIARRIGFDNHLWKDFIRRCDCLLLSIITDCRFMCYLPSALAISIMLYVLTSVDEHGISVQCQDQLISILGSNKEKVEGCCRFMDDVALWMMLPQVFTFTQTRKESLYHCLRVPTG